MSPETIKPMFLIKVFMALSSENLLNFSRPSHFTQPSPRR